MTIYAFPSGHNPQRGRQEDGMTLRDYFAAKAMQSIQIPVKTSLNIDHWTIEESTNFAKVAYQIADAMLKVRDA